MRIQIKYLLAVNVFEPLRNTLPNVSRIFQFAITEIIRNNIKRKTFGAQVVGKRTSLAQVQNAMFFTLSSAMISQK